MCFTVFRVCEFSLSGTHLMLTRFFYKIFQTVKENLKLIPCEKKSSVTLDSAPQQTVKKKTKINLFNAVPKQKSTHKMAE